MKDIVKCEGTDCKRKESCERFVSEPLPKFQAYLCMPVSVKIVDECRWYLEETLDTSNLIN